MANVLLLVLMLKAGFLPACLKKWGRHSTEPQKETRARENRCQGGETCLGRQREVRSNLTSVPKCLHRKKAPDMEGLLSLGR